MLIFGLRFNIYLGQRGYLIKFMRVSKPIKQRINWDKLFELIIAVLAIFGVGTLTYYNQNNNITYQNQNITINNYLPGTTSSMMFVGNIKSITNK